MENKVSRAQMDTLPKVIAIDFDGTLVSDEFPEIGEKNLHMFNTCKLLQAHGVKLILWTSRDNENLSAAIEYCKGEGLYFDAVNENIKEVRDMFANDTRKVYADLYIDDRSIPHTMSPSLWAERLGLSYHLDFKEG